MQTVRQQIISLLRLHEMDAMELSQALGIAEKQVYVHLEHIARSLAAKAQKIAIRPSRCLACGYVFEKRTRFTRPGRCPRCKKSHLTNPVFAITPDDVKQ